MTQWILIIGINVLVAFPDGSTVRDTHTMETRHYDSQEACDSAGKVSKLNVYANNQRKAQAFGATIKELDIEYHCVDASEVL